MKVKVILSANILMKIVLLNVNVKVIAIFITSLLSHNKFAATLKINAKILRQGYVNYSIRILSQNQKICVATVKMSAKI